jgi:LemA protein
MMYLALGVGAAFVVAIAPMFIWATFFNRLVRRRNRVEQAFAALDGQMVHRHDLVPRLVDAVHPHDLDQGELLQEVLRLRGIAAAAAAGAAIDGTPGADRETRLRAEAALSAALGQLRLAIRDYPRVQTDEGFLRLRRMLDAVAERIAGAHRAYDSAVTAYNEAIGTFPGSLVARIAGFAARPVFAAAEDQRADAEPRQLFTPA